MVAESLFQIMCYSNMESTCLTLNSKIIYSFESAVFEKYEECKAKDL